MKRMLSVLLLALLSASAAVWADLGADIQSLQQQWAKINYDTAAADKEQAFAALADKADAVVSAYPRRAEALIWRGIINSTYAGAKGGLGALSLVKSAKADFEAAIAIDGNSMDGSAYTSLGSLYYQVPGWPIGFGNSKKAREFLQKGLDVNPYGIDANYFYGDYLLEQGDYQQAAIALEKALAAPDRPNRPLADQGRRAEARELLAKVNSKRKN